jgi:hypothetical protein
VPDIWHRCPIPVSITLALLFLSAILQAFATSSINPFGKLNMPALEAAGISRSGIALALHVGMGGWHHASHAFAAEQKFEPAGFATSLGEKDIRLALAAAEMFRVRMPLASVVHDRLLTLMARGGEALDWSAVGKLAAEDAGLPREGSQ